MVIINTLKLISSFRCIVILGGSFDPVHNGHIALGEYFASLLQADELRIIPAGNPWQKNSLHASSIDRIEMLKRAFNHQMFLIVIDEQEIHRTVITYTIDTLKALRKEFGSMVSMIFLIGADQLLSLNTWYSWKELFNYVHLCVTTRPGFEVNSKNIPNIIKQEFIHRTSNINILRNTSHGKVYFTNNVNINISSTMIRNLLKQNKQPISLIPRKVLEYIEQYHLYQN